ncbi:MAG: DUF1629 domain-containing protein [Pseudomonadota bacterium]
MATRAGQMTATPPVWFATGSVDSSGAKPILPVGDHEEDKAKLSSEEIKENAKRQKELVSRYRAGREVPAEEIGTQFALMTTAKKPARPQPFMKMFGRLVVTSETREVLEGLDPGPLKFHPIEVLNAARTAPLWEGAELHLMQVLTCRRAMVVEDSKWLSKRVGTCADGEARYMATALDMDDALTVTAPTDGTAEIWLDDRLDGGLFLSGRIAKALKTAKLTRGWGLKRCVVKTLH